MSHLIKAEVVLTNLRGTIRNQLADANADILKMVEEGIAEMIRILPAQIEAAIYKGAHERIQEKVRQYFNRGPGGKLIKSAIEDMGETITQQIINHAWQTAGINIEKREENENESTTR